MHTERCGELERLDHRRFVSVDWWMTSSVGVEILVEALDRPGLLADVVRALADHGFDIVSSASEVGEDGVAREHFGVLCSSADQLEAVCRHLHQLNGVITARREGAFGG